MLDENLPVFYLSPSENPSTPYNSFYYHGKGGDEPTPAYQVQRADPGQASSENQYLAALFDAYNPDILYAEINLEPQWSQPPSKEEWARRNGPTSVPPPPEPLIPQEFVVQLYNPDQQVVIKRESSTLGGTRYDFSMPQVTFRAQSTSELDKASNDPAFEATTPKIYFSWKREGKLSKDMSCWVRGNSNTAVKNKKHGRKEPDINVALCKGLKEVQIYESNMHRIEMEDVKGLEVVLLLSAAAIKDIYYGNDLHKTFNITGVPGGANAGGRRRSSGTAQTHPGQAASGAQGSIGNAGSSPPGTSTGGPNANPRTQWAIDAETARLRAKSEAEAREIAQKESQRRRENQRLAEEDERRARKMQEDEERERKRRQREIDAETERLKRQYPQNAAILAPHPGPAQGVPSSNHPYVSSPYAQVPPPTQHQQHLQPQPPPQHSMYTPAPALPPRPVSWAQPPTNAPAPYDPNAYPQMPPPQQTLYPQYPQQQQYPQPVPNNSGNNFLNPNFAPPQQQQHLAPPSQKPQQHGPNKTTKPRRSFFGLRSLAESEGIIAGSHNNSSNNGRLRSQSSAMW